MPRWEQVLEPLDAQLRADGTVGPVRFRAVASRPIAIPRVSVPLFPVRQSAQVPATPALVKRSCRDGMPVLGRLRLHLDYVRAVDALGPLVTSDAVHERPWFRHEVERLERAKRRARRVGDTRLEIPSVAPAAVASLVEFFGLRAVTSALANVAATDDPLRHTASIGALTPHPVRINVSESRANDTGTLSARERGARRGFFVA
jgi:hypothetical protein